MEGAMKVGQIIKIELEVNIAVSRCLYGNGSKVEACQIDRLYANKQTRLRGLGQWRGQYGLLIVSMGRHWPMSNQTQQ